ncbi:MAG: wax ester/triacylglycerol synthase family O-acyltransferase [Patulibacter sp.]
MSADAEPGGAGMLRPSALDQAFLELEQHAHPPLHIGWAVELEGGAPSAALMRAVLAGAIGATPALTRRLVRDPITGSLRWFDDPWFDAGAHVDALALPSMADPAAVDALLTRLFAERLPRDRPLWRLQTLSDGERTLMTGQLHHVIADGIGSVELALALVGGILSDQTPVAPPLPAPTLLEGVRDDLAGVLRALTDVSAVGDLVNAVRIYAQRLTAAAQPAWDGPRLIARSSVPLDPLRGGARAHGGTVTAALIVAVARALRPTGVIDPHGGEAFVPLNARRAGDDLANPISVIYAPLHATGDPVAALVATTRALRAAREEAGSISDISRRADDLPAAVRGTVTRQIAGQFFAPVIVSSVPGPPEQIELFGRRITGVWGWAPSPAGQPVALTALSYAGRLHLTLVGDADGLVDGAETLRTIGHELEQFHS